MSRRRALHAERQGEQEEESSDAANGTAQTKLPDTSKTPLQATISVAAIAFHVVMVGYYSWLLYYGNRLMTENKKILDPEGKMPDLGGRFKFLTHINQWVQLGFFTLQLVADLLPHRPSQRQLQRATDFLFTTVAVPLCLFIVVTFWGIYAVDRKLVYPEVFDKFVHPVINHLWHTAIAVFVLVEMYLVAHRHPSTGAAAVMIFCYTAAYISWVVVIFLQTGFWVYPFMRVLQPAFMTLFFASTMFFTLGLYLVGRRASVHLWGAAHCL